MLRNMHINISSVSLDFCYRLREVWAFSQNSSGAIAAHCNEMTYRKRGIIRLVNMIEENICPDLAAPLHRAKNPQCVNGYTGINIENEIFARPFQVPQKSGHYDVVTNPTSDFECQ